MTLTRGHIYYNYFPLLSGVSSIEQIWSFLGDSLPQSNISFYCLSVFLIVSQCCWLFSIQSSDVSWRLLLLGVCHHLPVCGHLCLLHHPWDQKQDLHGNQHDVSKEGSSARDPGASPWAPTEAEEDERLRRGWACFSGVWQFFFCTMTEVQIITVTGNLYYFINQSSWAFHLGHTKNIAEHTVQF